MRRLAWIVVLAGCSHSTAAHQQDAAIQGADAPPPQSDAPPDAAMSYRFECDKPAPPGSPAPMPPPTYAGTCPTLVAGENTFTSGGITRTFQLVLPTTPMPGEVYPVMFMWHWLKATSSDFINTGMVQQAVDDQRFIGIAPDSIVTDIALTKYDMNWPFDITQTQQRMDQEFAFFDDMLSCVEQQFNVNQNCVSSVGVSAGALFNDQLVQARSATLSSFVSLSGGVGDTIIKGWNGAGAHKLPGLVLWGGDGPPTMMTKDILGCFGIGMDFSVASHTLETGMTTDGHFLVECIHNCGHQVPPITPPPGKSQFAGIWEFLFNHPFWLPAGQSPYQQEGLQDLPAWCAIGQGNATPRSDPNCPPPINPCPS